MLVAAALALSLAAAPDVRPYPPTPFPPPRLAPYSDKLKCDTGTVLTVSWEKNQMQATTPAGVVTYKAGIDAQVFDKDGRPVGAVSQLTPGDRVRIYYLVEDGAKVLEVDRTQ